MNTNKSTGSSSSLSKLSNLRGLLPNKLTTALIGMGWLAQAQDSSAIQPVVTDVPELLQPGLPQSGLLKETGRTGEHVTQILAQPPADQLKVRAIQILSTAIKPNRKSFMNGTQQDEFFQILTAMKQEKKTKEEAFFQLENSGRDYLINFTDEELKKLVGSSRAQLITLMVN